MDNSCRLRTLYAISIYMTHYIMSYKLFSFLCYIIVDVVCMCLKLFNLFISNSLITVNILKSKLLFSLGKGNPKLSPCFEFHVR